jgi:glycosyltransferase involved in cell wall biosynthesis
VTAGAARTAGRPDITVVVPTYRRPAELARLLRALAGQDAPGLVWDVVVVDNDPPGARPVVAGAAGAGLRVAYLAEPVPGTARARNRGLGAASGEVVVCVDDDVVPEPGWLAALVAPILAGDCDVTGGRVVLDPAVTRPFWLNEEALGGYLARYDRGGAPVDLVDPADYVITANAAFRAALVREVGGFDTALGPVGAVPLANEELALCRRLHAAGARIRYVPATVVHELPRERLRVRYLLRRTFTQGRSDWLLDRDTYVARPWRGAPWAARYLRRELALRWRQGLWRPSEVVLAACDLARAAGFLREAARHRAGAPSP